MKVILQDAVVLGYCRRGCRIFAERYGLNWSDFVLNGIDVTDIEHIDDVMVRDLIAQARRRMEASDGQQ